MKRSILQAIAILGLFALSACQKKESKLDPIPDVTYSENFTNNLTDENVWFEYDVPFSNSSNQEVVNRQGKIQSFDAGWLLAVEDKKYEHEFYLKWVKVSDEPLLFRMTGYLRPAPIHIHEDPGGRTMGHLIPSEPPPPR
ncbi:MAG TPA: hypothetical protein VGQ53_14205 [Chitinophagaceae bacterium]|jgi:hypothetical protein|nr:hypothetical protein [Chitinophagaceae bacterium]